MRSNKYQSYCGPGRRQRRQLVLTYSIIMPTVSPACCLCINIHHYTPPRIVLVARCAGRWATRSAAAVMVQCQVLNR